MNPKDVSEMVRTVNPLQKEGSPIQSALGSTSSEEQFELPKLPSRKKLFSKMDKAAAQAFGNLTQKQLVYMYYYYGCNITMSQIAEKLGVNKSTVSRTIRRGIKALGKYYKILNFAIIDIPNDDK